MSMGMSKRKRASPPLPEEPPSKKLNREDTPPPLGANGEPLEVFPDRAEVVAHEPRVIKQHLGLPHSSVLAVVQAERAVETGEERELESKAPISSLENLSHGQLVPSDLPGGVRPEQSDATLSLSSPRPKVSSTETPADRVHLIPCHAGWFSWNSVNVLERRGLPEFFDGKSKLKTPEIYLEHRNAIICKYRENLPKVITIEDMKDVLVGDGNAAARILEFLDHWGIINYQAALDPNKHLPDWLGQAALIEEAPDRKLQATPLTEPPLQSLYAFDSVGEPVSKPAPSQERRESGASLLETKAAEALSFSDGPSVEYHCNACAADCSKHRYHCQKQADFDLCPDCYNDGKFGEGMTSTDFIRMDALTDTADSDGGGWTDQETLLLLEALELFGDNWSEIAEHVATKSKSQCILHFIRLPIEDPFLEDMETAGYVTSAPPASRLSSDSRNTKLLTDKDTAADCASTPASASRKDTEGSALTDSGQRSKESGSSRTGRPMSNAESKAEDVIAFADAGNPVMTQVAFLAAMVGPRVAAAAAQSALMVLSGKNPAHSLAGRNCFVMDPPDFDWSKPGPDPSRSADHKAIKGAGVEFADKEGTSQAAADNDPHVEALKEASQQDVTPESKDHHAADVVVESGKEVGGASKNVDSQEPEEDAAKREEDQADGEDDSAAVVENEDVVSVVSVKRAAASALAAAAVKSKLLADQEEREIQHLVGIVIENQLRKLEIKLKHFSELEVMLAKECEQVDRSRQKYVAERQRLITSRLNPPSQAQSTSISSLFPLSKPAGLTVPPSSTLSATPGLATAVPGTSGIPRPTQGFSFKPGGHPSSVAPFVPNPSLGVGPGPTPLLQHPGHPGPPNVGNVMK